MNKPSLAARLRAAFLGDLEEQLAALNTGLLALELSPSSADALKSVFRVMHTLKGAAHATDQPLVEAACHHLEAVLAEARDGKKILGAADFSLLFAAADALADTARRIAANEPVDESSPLARLVERISGSTSAAPALPVILPDITNVVVPESVPPAAVMPRMVSEDSTVRVAPEKLDTLLSQVGRLLAVRTRIARRTEQSEALDRSIHAAHAALRGLLAADAAHLPASVAEALRSVERLMRDVTARSVAIATQGIEDDRELADVSDSLAEGVRRVRMVPFSTACEPLPRLVRDVASDTGKQGRLVVLGGDIEADRPVLDALKDSLLHLVRNAIDHGVEPPAERQAHGKTPIATITVSAALHGERLTVTVSDDGAGLDIAAIRRKLATLGRAVPESDADVARTLFESGFSTRDVTTTISGRGVGLDAVEAAMLRVRGSVSVAWVPGNGTTFTLECPLTLAAIRAVLVKCSAQVLALPTSNVEQLVRIRATEVRRAEGREVILTGEAPIPLVSLAAFLGPPFVAAPPSDIFPALILTAGDRRVAVLVDAVENEQELVVRPILRGHSAMGHVSGGALLGTGELVLVLNPVSLVQQALVGRSSANVIARPGKRSRILVADDSMTTRALEQNLLEAAGYEVVTAVDGADAWRQLMEGGADLLVSDIEMPNMDGLTLCRTVRASDRFANLPVVLVTSLDNPAAREQGMAAGADAYVGKASAGQAGLLDTVRELLA
jgi:two-component system chemotaxis sensor kinase CheA